MSDGDRLGLERLKSCEDNSNFCRIFRNRLRNPVKSGDEGPLVVINDVTDIDDHSHSESDWENEFTHEGRAGSESGAESGIAVHLFKLLLDFDIFPLMSHSFPPPDSQHRTRSPTHFCDDK